MTDGRVERIRSARDEQELRDLRLVGRVREAITQAPLARYSEASGRELQKQMARLDDERGLLGSGRAGTLPR